MGKVKLLSESIVSRISAGEVVESPASVIKELIENSLDAGAENITVEVRSGGKKFISVKDDGAGIEPDDIERIFKRHATSKIGSLDDLYNIKSLGFRGEALYSIGAVSDVLLQSKASGYDGAGKEIHIRGGENMGIRDISRTEGTTVEVRELFFNTPARKKFLRSDTTEFRRIIGLITPYTIAFYNKRFSLLHNGRIVFDYHPSPDIIDRLCEVAGIKKEYVVTGTREIKEKNIILKVFLGDINLQFPVKNRQYIFVNNRPVYSRNISYTVNSVYEDIFPRDVYPAFAIFIQLPPKDVDVNVHPTKREVKLKEEGFISSVLSDLCKEVLFKEAKAKQVDISYPERPEDIRGVVAVPSISDVQTEQQLFDTKAGHLSTERGLREKLNMAVYTGCYKNKYLFFDAGDVLFVIDQHAAHERIRYELLKKQWEKGTVEVQRLLTPVIVKINQEEMDVWEDGYELLEELGFLTTRWDAYSIAVHGFPKEIKAPEVALRNILGEGKFTGCDKETIAKRACKGAVSAGERIREEEAIYIKNELLRCETPFVCPHGRPTVVEFTEAFFDRQFLR